MNPVSCQSSLDAFHELTSKEEQKLESVSQRFEDGCRDLIVLRFAAGALVFLADADTDTIEVRYQESGSFDFPGLRRVDDASPWLSLVGRTFGWGSVTINQQGYQDGVLLSFGGLEPSVALTVAASSLKVFEMTESTR